MKNPPSVGSAGFPSQPDLRRANLQKLCPGRSITFHLRRLPYRFCCAVPEDRNSLAGYYFFFAFFFAVFFFAAFFAAFFFAAMVRIPCFR
jgi:hypothetical protein